MSSLPSFVPRAFRIAHTVARAQSQAVAAGKTSPAQVAAATSAAFRSRSTKTAPSTTTSAPTPAPAQVQPSPSIKAETRPRFFSMAGQQAALSRVGAVFNPFDKRTIFWTNPVTGRTIAPSAFFSSPITKTAFLAAGTAATVGVAGNLAAGGGLFGTKTAIGATATGAGGVALKKYFFPAAVGAAGAFALSSSFGKPSQDARQQATSAPTLNPTWTDASTNITTQDQYVNNDIFDSPGASIASSPSQSASQDRIFTPSIDAPLGQGIGQEADGGSGWLLPALVLGAAFLLSK